MEEPSVDHEPISTDGQRPGQPDLRVYHPERIDSGPVIVEDELTRRRRGVNQYSDAMVEAMAERGVAEHGDSVLSEARAWEDEHYAEITPGEIFEPLKAAAEWIFVHERHMEAGADVLKPNQFGWRTSQRSRLREVSDRLRQEMLEVVRWLKTSPNGLKGAREAVGEVKNIMAEAKTTFEEIKKEVEQEK